MLILCAALSIALAGCSFYDASSEDRSIPDFSEEERFPGDQDSFRAYRRNVETLVDSGRLTVSREGVVFKGNAAKKVLEDREYKKRVLEDLKRKNDEHPEDLLTDFSEVEEDDFIEVPSSTLESKANSFDEALKVEVDVAAAVREAKKRAAEKEKSKGKEGKKEDGRATNIGD